MDQEIEERLLSLKLKKKEQWYCDFCGEIIESDRDRESIIVSEWFKFSGKDVEKAEKIL
ncbi:hypothetical protein [Bacillus tequilensis]|uniref:hypothetical protein n=1 Tax=Bacillus tequilensis TaxID=227866 RepID=UPI0004B63EE1|nr:hypothetical protein [Bacillus tequilensis]SPT99075.1 Uncharacterised protein [Bacillus tequilensis]